MNTSLVNHPAHYNQGDIECIDAMVSAFGVEATINFCHLNSFKYNWRCMDKGETPEVHIQDINKSIWYMEKMKELYKQKLTPVDNVDQNDFEKYINRL